MTCSWVLMSAPSFSAKEAGSTATSFPSRLTVAQSAYNVFRDQSRQYLSCGRPRLVQSGQPVRGLRQAGVKPVQLCLDFTLHLPQEQLCFVQV
jgi:hypothetical protein